jgi:hypothetical protein
MHLPQFETLTRRALQMRVLRNTVPHTSAQDGRAVMFDLEKLDKWLGYEAIREAA